VEGAQVARASVIRANDEFVIVAHACWSCDRQVSKRVARTLDRGDLSWYCEPCDVGWVGPGIEVGTEPAV
jgi:ribosomal protein L37AE/L43A